jgi:hypothetical protein
MRNTQEPSKFAGVVEEQEDKQFSDGIGNTSKNLPFL